MNKVQRIIASIGVPLVLLFAALGISTNIRSFRAPSFWGKTWYIWLTATIIAMLFELWLWSENKGEIIMLIVAPIGSISRNVVTLIGSIGRNIKAHKRELLYILCVMILVLLTLIGLDRAEESKGSSISPQYKTASKILDELLGSRLPEPKQETILKAGTPVYICEEETKKYPRYFHIRANCPRIHRHCSDTYRNTVILEVEELLPTYAVEVEAFYYAVDKKGFQYLGKLCPICLPAKK